MAEYDQLFLCGIVHIIFEDPTILTNGEQTMHVLSLLVKSATKCNRGDLNFVRNDLAREFPLSWLIWICLLLEEAHSLVCIADSEVVAIPGDDKLLYWVTFVV